MDRLKGDKLTFLPLKNLEWKRDLVYFEGPLISEFVNSKGETFLKYWCDCDDEYNRWMFIKIREQDRLRLVLGEQSLYKAVIDQPDPFVFICDEADDEDHSEFYVVLTENLPDSYIPDEKAFLSISSYKEDKGVRSFIFENKWELEDLKNLFRKFNQVYDFLYAGDRGIVSNLSPSNWQQGGFSAVHFFENLNKSIPINDKGSLNSIYYASPGYLKVKSNDNIADQVLIAINAYLKSKDSIDRTYSELYAQIKSLNLNGMHIDDAHKAFDIDTRCVHLYRKLKREMNRMNFSWLDSKIGSKFELCKIVMAYYRRLSYFGERIEDGSVRAVSNLIKL